MKTRKNIAINYQKRNITMYAEKIARKYIKRKMEDEEYVK
jgi:hypothetical protein